MKKTFTNQFCGVSFYETPACLEFCFKTSGPFQASAAGVQIDPIVEENLDWD
ncbi:MAG: hypothetical protein J6Y32_01095 [Bacteroidales bacterium]|nr:hypothetical protein [Bacteroidales bacterium]